MYYVYILKLRNNNFYTGSTSNPKARIQEHQSGQVDSTKNYLPIKLACYLAFENKYIALKFEKYLKSGSGIAFRNKHLV